MMHAPAWYSLAAPDLPELAAQAHRRSRLCAWGSVLLGSLTGVVYSISPALALALLMSLVVLLSLWHFPRTILYVLIGATCLFETFARSFPDSLTDRVPFFWNLNTVFEVYAGYNIRVAPINVMELFLIVGAAFSAVRAVYTSNLSLTVGSIFRPMLAYLAFVGLAIFNGLAAGGDYRLALQDARAQIYFPIIYLIVINQVEKREDLRRCLLVLVFCIGLKAILYTFRRYVTLAGVDVSDQGVGSHEEVFFFNAFVLLLIALKLFGQRPHLRTAMWLLLPLVVVANIACNRRAGIAILMVGLPILVFAAVVILRQQRWRVIGVSVAVALVAGCYYQLFKDSSSELALPARAIQSQFQPNARDAASDRYRRGESKNLMATLREAPLLGWGYGRPFLTPVDLSYIEDAYEHWDIWPHNTLLGVWMRTGTFGFFAFWIMLVVLIIRSCRALRMEDDELRMVALFTLPVVVMWVLLGLFDMGFAQFRSVLLAGIAVGLLESAYRLAEHPVTRQIAAGAVGRKRAPAAFRRSGGTRMPTPMR